MGMNNFAKALQQSGLIAGEALAKYYRDQEDEKQQAFRNDLLTKQDAREAEKFNIDSSLGKINLASAQSKLDEQNKLTPELDKLQLGLLAHQQFADRPDTSNFVGDNATKNPLSFIEDSNVKPLSNGVMSEQEPLGKATPRDIGLASPVAYSSDPRAQQAMTNLEQASQVGERADLMGQAHDEKMAENKAKQDEINLRKHQENQDREDIRQEKMAADYGKMISQRIQGARTGSLGDQQRKLDSAIHARNLIDSIKSGDTVPNEAVQQELVESVASMLSNSSQASEARVMALKSPTAEGKLKELYQYVSGQPAAGSSPELLNQLYDIADRQGKLSQKMRDKYVQDVRQNADASYPGLKKEHRDKFWNINFGNNYPSDTPTAPTGAASGNGFKIISVK